MKTIFVMMAMIGIAAFAIDIGYIMLTRTQLQAAADASSLAAGTELRPGLGYNPTKMPAEVETAAKSRAVEYAGKNPNGDREVADGGTYADPDRNPSDVILRTAWQNADGTWSMSDPGTIEHHNGYNAVTVSVLRNQSGSTSGDGPVPLLLAPLIGTSTQNLAATATAVLLPVSGIGIQPGGGNANVLPFAFDAATYCAWLSSTGVSSDDLPYYCESCQNCGDEGVFEYIDNYALNDANGDGMYNSDGEITSGTGDSTSELDLYPHENHALAPGNRGTVDIGGEDNSTADIARQIVEGISPQDLQDFEEDASLDINAEEQVQEVVNGETGLSAGFKDELESIIGVPRAMLIFESYTDDSGNNVYFTLVDIVGIVIVDVQLTGGEKHVWVQPVNVQISGTIADGDGTIGPSTTVFHPLILIE